MSKEKLNQKGLNHREERKGMPDSCGGTREKGAMEYMTVEELKKMLKWLERSLETTQDSIQRGEEFLKKEMSMIKGAPKGLLEIFFERDIGLAKAYKEKEKFYKQKIEEIKKKIEEVEK